MSLTSPVVELEHPNISQTLRSALLLGIKPILTLHQHLLPEAEGPLRCDNGMIRRNIRTGKLQWKREGNVEKTQSVG
eukprot:767911-Hanusia_phi.AAC.6